MVKLTVFLGRHSHWRTTAQTLREASPFPTWFTLC